MNFLIKVACAVGIASCPLPKPITRTIQASDVTECRTMATTFIAALSYNPKHFVIECKPAK